MKILSPLFLIPLALAACVDPEDGADELLDETSQEVTSTSLSSHTCWTTSPCNFTVGAANQACFISGVRGKAAGAYTGITGNTLTIYASANNVPLTVTTTCVNPAANVTSARWNTNFGVPSVTIPNTTASSRCFLNIFSGQGGGLTHTADTIRTFKENGVWKVGGSTVAGSYLSGGAVCFDVASNQGSWGWTQGAGSITGNIASNSSGGVACGLTQLGGVFNTNSLSDGVHIDYQAGPAQWIWTFVNFKSATANCIK